MRLLTLLLAVAGAALQAGEPGVESLDFHALLRPAPRSAVLSDPDFYVWCGSMVRSDDGKYHLYFSRWPKKYGFQAWVTSSEIAHAVGDTPLGPFRFAGVALPARGKEFWDGLCTHNPTVLKVGSKYFLYYMGNTGDGQVMPGLNWTHRNRQRIGVAVADSPDGPWQRSDKPVLDVSTDDDAADSLMVSNPAVTRRPDGTFLMIYKAVGKKRPAPFGGPVVHLTATADAPTGPFTKQRNPIFTAPGADFPAEDPFVWFDARGRRYYAIVKDQKGYFTGHKGRSLALWESGDGLDWRLSAHPLVTLPEIHWADGRTDKVLSLERPQVLFAPDGTPSVLLVAVQDKEQPENTYNLRIPLGRR